MSSSSGISIGGITVDTFTGTSTYSSSFQQVLTRAVGIASLPIQEMQVDVNNLTNEQSTYAGLAATFGQLQNALLGINDAQTGNQATSSNTGILTAGATTSALPGTYAVTVDNLGSQATALSNAGTTPVTDPTTQNISSSATFTLSVNGVATTITPSGTSLDDLANAINSAGAGVQATVVNVGGSSGADYRLALTSTGFGANTIQLADSSSAVLTSQIATGSSVQYTVNGSTEISSNSRQVTIAPGLSASFVSASPGNPVTITVGEDTSALSTALNNFVQAYNSAASAIATQTGTNAGPLEGQSIVFTMRQVLNSMVQYFGSGNLNLDQLGLSVDENGQMSFDSSALANLSSNDIQNFLGSVGNGGFIDAANNALNSLTDPTSGAFQTSITSLQNQITAENNQITDKTASVNAMQESLMQQLSQADAAIANLQSQVSFFTTLMQTQNATAFNNA